MQRSKAICDLCGQQISLSNLSKHLRRHQNHPETFKKVEGEIICEYCHKVCKNLKSKASHQRFCEANSDRIISPLSLWNLSEHTVWNKGLTKESDDRILLSSIKKKETFRDKISNGWKPYFSTDQYWTKERRDNKSLEKISLYKQYPEKHPNRKLASNKNMTYPEKVAADWLSQNNIDFLFQYRTEFENTFRFVDFYIPEYNLYLEIDGEYWHKDHRDLDKRKDEYAYCVQKIFTLRISSKEKIIEKLSQYFNHGM